MIRWASRPLGFPVWRHSVRFAVHVDTLIRPRTA